jgi:hypothetical protein
MLKRTGGLLGLGTVAACAPGAVQRPEATWRTRRGWSQGTGPALSTANVSVKVDGAAATATVTTVDGIATVTVAAPAAGWAGGSTHKVDLTIIDRTVSWTFGVANIRTPVFAIEAEDFDNNGVAPAATSVPLSAPILTMVPSASALTVTPSTGAKEPMAWSRGYHVTATAVLVVTALTGASRGAEDNSLIWATLIAPSVATTKMKPPRAMRNFLNIKRGIGINFEK